MCLVLAELVKLCIDNVIELYFIVILIETFSFVYVQTMLRLTLLEAVVLEARM